MKLISMIDFVISQWDKDITREDFAQSMIIYATFLKQPLTLGMFIPCDEDGNVLEDVTGHGMTDKYSEKCKKYQQAKERVLFEGFELVEQYKWGFKIQMVFEDFAISLDICYEDNIEELFTLSFDPEFTLTDSAIKQLGL